MVLEKVRVTGESPYEKWMKDQGVPIFDALAGVDDITELPREPWARMGGKGTFVQLRGTTELERNLYVVEIPGGGALEPEKHLYDEALFVLQGRGLTEVWQEGGQKVSFEWGKGSLFAPPINTWHRLVNGSREPALVLAYTTAPKVMNGLYDSEFVFNCDHVFKELFDANGDYFARGDKKEKIGRGSARWYTNFIPDAWAEFLDPWEQKVVGGQQTGYEMARDFPHGHIGQWSSGTYHKAHYHGPGAVLVGLEGRGYVVLWHYSLGIHPYQDGHEDQVITVDWKPMSIYVPPDGWYHSHMNTGKGPARHIAFYSSRPSRMLRDGLSATTTSTQDGGTLIDYEDEDPEIRVRFKEALKKEGVEFAMPDITYR